jgi:carbon-monoxide dehydrogenase medium subunit
MSLSIHHGQTGRVSARHLISLRRIEELRGISETPAGLHLGALTTVAELGRSVAVRERYTPILDAALQMAARQVRNLATVGGNISSAVPCADLPPILTAMNATVTLWSPAGERNVPLEFFFTGPRSTVCRGDEILTAIHVPELPPRFGAAYARFAQRDGNAIAVAAVAASLLLGEDGAVTEARVVLSAVAPVPKIVPGVGETLVGRLPEEDALQAVAITARDAAEPITDVRGSADFRRNLVEVLTRRALQSALDRAKETRA